jgi:hypothetical protein
MKITFEDWEIGNVVIDTTYYSKSIEQNPPKLISWYEIDNDIKIEIRKTQKDIFNDLCNNELAGIKLEFEKRYKNSDFKLVLIKKELEKLKEVLFDNTETNDTNSNYKWGNICPFDNEFNFRIIEIREYSNKYYIDGYTKNYDFVYSPKSKYAPNDNMELMIELQSEVLYTYYKYLNELKNGGKLLFNNRYWNQKTFDLFTYLAENFFHNKSIAKFNLIFHFLKEIKVENPTNYQFSMSSINYYLYVKENVDKDFNSSKNDKPSMNKPSYNEDGSLFLPLYELKDKFENLYKLELNK